MEPLEGGQSLHVIGRAFDKPHNSIHSFLRGPGLLFDSLVATYSLLVFAVYTWPSPRGARGRSP
jgi:hypothetical protein